MTAGIDSYVMGSNPHETARLQKQAALYEPSTRHLFRQAGLRPGMRVLELGSGAGDVAMLAAELVGPSGQVVGVDRDPAVLQTARERAQARGLTQVTFVESALEELTVEGAFDAIVGRLVLIYVADPSALLRRLVTRLRGPSIVAFQDLDWGIGPVCTVRSPLLEKLWYWVPEMFRRAGLNPRAGMSLRETFIHAGLPNPSMHIDAPTGGGDDFAGLTTWRAVCAATCPPSCALALQRRMRLPSTLLQSACAKKLSARMARWRFRPS
jgi:SAM-dependent methyltransferase